jgi:hypothetical protein
MKITSAVITMSDIETGSWFLLWLRDSGFPLSSFFHIRIFALKILVACEFSGIVREAFSKRGHRAVSCDLLPTSIHGPHHQGDVTELLNDEWDMMIAHPPCTDLAVSGARWHKRKGEERINKAVEFFMLLANANIPRIAIELPVSIISSRYGKPDQTFQPWQFGHGEIKRSCLWLKNLPKLKTTNEVVGRKPVVHYMSPSADRGQKRSITLQGIADAMAEQWGHLKPFSSNDDLFDME